MTDEPSGEVKHGGLSIEQYSGVAAAIAEKISLAEVLAQERIDPATWPAAERAWRQAIAGSQELQLQHIQKRRIAEDCLARKTEPLDTDPAAWTGLLSALAMADDPNALVAGLGITMADVTRLGRHWKRKTAADPELAKKLQELAPTAKPPAKVTVGPPALQPFPWTPPKREEDLRNEDASIAAAALGILDMPVGDVQRHKASFQLDEAKAPAPERSVVAEAPQAAFVSHETAWAPSVVPAEPTTPFEAPDPEARGVTLTQYASLVARLQAPGADRADALRAAGLDDTSYAAVCAHYERTFSKKAMLAVEFGRLLSLAQRALAEPPASTSRRAPRTADMPSAAMMREETSVAPAPSAASTGLPRSAPSLSVAQYAWVFTTLRRAAHADLPSVLERLRLTPETRKELDADWAARIRKDSGVRLAFSEGLERLLPPEEAQAIVRSIVAEGQRRISSTVDMPMGMLAAPAVGQDSAARPLPFAAAAPPAESAPPTEDPSLIPLATYAQIAAHVTSGSDLGETLERFGVDPATWQTTVRGYARRFAERPASRAEFDKLVQRWSAGRAG